MTSKPLDNSTINALLARNEKIERRAESGIRAAEWPDEEGKQAILDALADGLDAVKIKRRYFALRPNPALGEVWIEPLDSTFAPCGYFNIRRLQEAVLDV